MIESATPLKLPEGGIKVELGKKEEVEVEVGLEEQIPHPVGYHLLVVMPQIDDTYGNSGIVKADMTMKHDHLLSMVGLVVDMGDLAYKDTDRFSSGPWCKRGDYVMFRTNSGTRFKVGGDEYRLINDDTIEAVVCDPRAVTRV